MLTMQVEPVTTLILLSQKDTSRIDTQIDLIIAVMRALFVCSFSFNPV